ncbi:cysteine-rich receptor-like protein kinase 10 isoform X2 [Herrania umbratica]|uniref:Cysteine-rich receptor-like protein kinase 10 isoform X2 n=1 Tax=Herrania umbratica TaxID=108875 RepID=A0A6J1B3I7_9ROSI|nr:cysteine-rich receptor-like protein kinase 10 isoform X2 [Herrania umbratica]
MVPFHISMTLSFCISLCLLCLNSEAAVVFLDSDCYSNTTTYSRNSIYQRNLNFLLSSLQSNATRENGFYNLTVGQDPPDIVYGLFLCRGDVTQDICQECVSTASGEILRRCPNQKTALVYYDECTLRYSNQSFFSKWQSEPGLQLLNTGNVSQPDRFMDLLANTTKEIATRAVADQSGKKFATEEANFTNFQTLYTLAQCTPDLPVSSCDTCLTTAIAFLPICCLGKQGGRVVFPSCNVRYELYPFYRITAQPPPQTPVRPSPPAPQPKEKNKVSSTIVIAIVVPVVVSVVLFAAGFCLLTRKRKKYDAVEQENAANEISTVESLQFDFATIEAATNKFSVDNKLGEGGFGPVYKGKLPNGQEIAVKRLSGRSSQGAEEYKNEVVLVAKLQHRNLVRLLGFCLEGEEKLLIYEFVRNKSLDYFLFGMVCSNLILLLKPNCLSANYYNYIKYVPGRKQQGQLNWIKRYKIIGGIARGILYLHEDSRLKIIHRDLKISNILLDDDMNPKISDFGMARIFGVDQSEGNTSRIVGTYGYMPPEYAMHGQFSVKSDVYSFGVIILELITGKKSYNFQSTDGADDLLSYVWKRWNNETPLELLDSSLRSSYSSNEVIRCIHIGLLCVQEDPAERPTMAAIVLMLNSYSVTLQAPQAPATFSIPRSESNFLTNEEGSDQSASKSIPFSVNEASISDLYPR